MRKLITITTVFIMSIYINAQKKDTIDPFGSSEDSRESWVGEKVNIDDHYIRQKDGSYVRKDIYEKQQNNTPFFVGGAIIMIGVIGFFIGRNKKINQ